MKALSTPDSSQIQNTLLVTALITKSSLDTFLASVDKPGDNEGGGAGHLPAVCQTCVYRRQVAVRTHNDILYVL